MFDPIPVLVLAFLLAGPANSQQGSWTSKLISGNQASRPPLYGTCAVADPGGQTVWLALGKRGDTTLSDVSNLSTTVYKWDTVDDTWTTLPVTPSAASGYALGAYDFGCTAVYRG